MVDDCICRCKFSCVDLFSKGVGVQNYKNRKYDLEMGISFWQGKIVQ